MSSPYTANSEGYGWTVTRTIWTQNHDHSRWWTLTSWLLGIGAAVVYCMGAR